MRDSGGHGGSSYNEISVPLIVFSTEAKQIKMKNYNEDNNRKIYNQIDFTPTISALLGLPIPLTNIGCIIPELIENLIPLENQLFVFYYNTKQLLEKSMKKFYKNNIDIEGIKKIIIKILSILNKICLLFNIFSFSFRILQNVFVCN